MKPPATGASHAGHSSGARGASEPAPHPAAGANGATGSARPHPKKDVPALAAVVEDRGDGTTLVRAIDAAGGEHEITMPTASGALIAFRTDLAGWIVRLGERATSWERS